MEVGKHIDAKVIIYTSGMWHKSTIKALAKVSTVFTPRTCTFAYTKPCNLKHSGNKANMDDSKQK